MEELNQNKMINGNKTAFPSDIHRYTDGGLTKREYFAAMAMQGMLANLNGALMKGGTKTLHPNHISEMSVIHADALLAELDKPKSE